MKHQKSNISLWWLMGLAVLLMIAALLIATGTSLARYRESVDAIRLQDIRKPLSIYLGTVEYPQEQTTEEEATTEATEPTKATEATEPVGTFVPAESGQWELTDTGLYQLKFAVANGLKADEFDNRDQWVYVRLIGSSQVLGAAEGTGIQLTVFGGKEPVVVDAVAAPIADQSELYGIFGGGWIFSFRDEDGEELRWLLEGRTLNHIEMALTVDGAAVTDISQLRLQVSSRNALEE